MNYKNIFRWILVLPGSFIIGFLSTFPLHWILYLTLSDEETFFNGLFLLKDVEHFLSPIVSMFVMVLFSFKIAPKYKFQSSSIIVILWVVFMLFSNIFIPNMFLDIRTFFTFISMLVSLYVNWLESKKEIVIN